MVFTHNELLTDIFCPAWEYVGVYFIIGWVLLGTATLFESEHTTFLVIPLVIGVLLSVRLFILLTEITPIPKQIFSVQTLFAGLSIAFPALMIWFAQKSTHYITKQ